ncbi:30S ribosomal protein S15 [bacterium]|nr:30S ribosomal protein S15 [bacterium]
MPAEESIEEVGTTVGSKADVIAKFKRGEGDTGSPEVQIALLTRRLEQLKTHFDKHSLDKHSKRGLLKIVSQRKRLLSYLRNEDITRYRTLIGELGLRK